MRVEGDLTFVAADQHRAGCHRLRSRRRETAALVAEYSDAQLQALKSAYWPADSSRSPRLRATRHLPTERFGSASETARAGPEPEPEGASS